MTKLEDMEVRPGRREHGDQTSVRTIVWWWVRTPKNRTMTEEGVGSGRREIDQGSSRPGTTSIPQIVA